MIQFNLLPDIKKEYIKARRLKHLIFTVSFLSSIVAIVIVVGLFSVVKIAQSKNIKDLTKDIESKISEIESLPDLTKVLTVQSQNNSLTSLHENNPYTSRIFSYLNSLTPANVSIAQLNLNMVDSIITIEGSASSFAVVNQYSDTIKFATFSYEDQTDLSAFSNVATELSRNEKSATYVLTFSFDPVLFNNTKVISLSVPKKITTRSSLGTPSIELFDQQSSEPDSSEGTN